MSKSFPIYVGVDGGATSTKVGVISNTNEVLSTYTGESANDNNVGFYQACQNVFNSIKEAVSLADQSSKETINLSNIRGICFSLAGVDRVRDKENWYNSICIFFKKELLKLSSNDTSDKFDDKTEEKSGNFLIPLIHIYNDSVSSAMAYNPDYIEGIVCIIGTGSIVCGFKNNETNINYRAGGWGPLFGDVCSGYAMGMTLLKNGARYYDIINNYKDENIKNEKIKNENVSKYIYNTLMKLANVNTYDAMLDWAYKGIEGDRNDNNNNNNNNNDDEKDDDNILSKLNGFKVGGKDVYERVASLAPVAIYGSDEDSVCFDIVSNSIRNIIKEICIVMDSVYPKEFVLQKVKENNKFRINIICGGSILLKSKNDKFINMLNKLLCYQLGGDSRQAFISFVKPEMKAEVGAARFIKNCYRNGIKQQRKK